MATTDEIAELRRLINESADITPYTSNELSARIDAVGSVRVVAADIWREKAARYATAVDIKEGNSDRKLSQLQSQAIKMADSLVASSGNSAAGGRVSRTRKIDRQ